MQAKRVRRSITKSVDLRVSVERAFDFLNDPANWPKWAIVNMKSAKPATDGWYDTETRQGKGQLKMVSNKPLGLLDHVWKGPQASWTVPARVSPNGDGCTFVMTFFQPPVLDDSAFDDAAKEVDIELAKLKELLEHEPGGHRSITAPFRRHALSSAFAGAVVICFDEPRNCRGSGR